MDEFRIIETVFMPLAGKGAPAFGLRNDTAIYTPPAGHDLVITTDAMIEGVHFLANEDAAVIARRLLRANLSDLAASGARPTGYLLALMGGKSLPDKWLKDFAKALKADQKRYGLTLFGGDTTSGAKSLSLSLTALGVVEAGRGLTRLGARPGDLVCVSGSIGDALLGLKCLTGERPRDDYLVQRFQAPEPRLGLGRLLLGTASATIDVSDGLVADVGHVCEASGVGATLYLHQVPLSDSALAYADGDEQKLVQLCTAGDDFELIFTLPKKQGGRLREISEKADLPISVIGEITKGAGVKVLDKRNRPITIRTPGYRHFRE